MELSFTLLNKYVSNTQWIKIESYNGEKLENQSMKEEHRQNILLLIILGLSSRFIIYVLGLCSFIVFYTYDTSAEVAIPGERLSYYLHPFVRWDSLYFIQIAYANCSYRFEQEHAFLPLYPILMIIIASLIPVNLSKIDSLALSGIIVSLFSFLSSLILLYLLTLKIFHSPRIAFLSSFLFIMSPASMFLTVVYSESLFFMLSLSGMLAFCHDKFLLASIFWTCSSATRSIGIFHSGFFVYRFLLVLFSSFPITRKFYQSMQMFLFTLISISGFMLFQIYGYNCVCNRDQSLVSSAAREWCHNLSCLSLSFLYTFVQKNYWNVGFLSYYEIKQIPNFMIAAPMYIFLIVSVQNYYSFVQKIANKERQAELFFLTVPFLIEWLLVSLVVIATAHVQIAIRLFSSTFPMMYWMGSFFLIEHLEIRKNTQMANRSNLPKTLFRFHIGNSCRGIGPLWLTYSISYALVGIVLFACFYPPA